MRAPIHEISIIPNQRYEQTKDTDTLYDVTMKTFGFTVTTATALLVHQAMAADTMIDIQWDDYSHFKLEETSSDVISKCGMSFDHP